MDKTLRGGMPGATAPRSPSRLKQLKRLGSDPDATIIFPVGNRMKKKRPTRRTWRGDDTTSGAAAVKKTAKVRTTRQKVCPLFWKAWGAVRARTGVGTRFPLRLLAQTPALWRGVIFEGCPTSELWDTPYIIVYVYFRDRKLLRPGTPRRPAKVDKTLRGGMPGWQTTPMPFRLKAHTRGTPHAY